MRAILYGLGIFVLMSLMLVASIKTSDETARAVFMVGIVLTWAIAWKPVDYPQVGS